MPRLARYKKRIETGRRLQRTGKRLLVSGAASMLVPPIGAAALTAGGVAHIAGDLIETHARKKLRQLDPNKKATKHPEGSTPLTRKTKLLRAESSRAFDRFVRKKRMGLLGLTKVKEISGPELRSISDLKISVKKVKGKKKYIAMLTGERSKDSNYWTGHDLEHLRQTIFHHEKSFPINQSSMLALLEENIMVSLKNEPDRQDAISFDKIRNKGDYLYLQNIYQHFPTRQAFLRAVAEGMRRGRHREVRQAFKILNEFNKNEPLRTGQEIAQYNWSLNKIID